MVIKWGLRRFAAKVADKGAGLVVLELFGMAVNHTRSITLRSTHSEIAHYMFSLRYISAAL